MVDNRGMVDHRGGMDQGCGMGHSMAKTMSDNAMGKSMANNAMSKTVSSNNSVSETVSGQELRGSRGSSQQGGDASEGLRFFWRIRGRSFLFDPLFARGKFAPFHLLS